ncbi:MAG: lactate racemase domain-containing protein, partial [Thermomicrobiales bacterium]
MSLDGLNVFVRGTLPRWRLVRQELNSEEIADIPAAMAEQFSKPGIGDTISPGARVAITCGSRGIHRIADITRAIVDQVRAHGGNPFIVPAMGSHGGATAEGQRALIAHYGVTEAAMGCPILSSMETVQLGTVEGNVPVHFDKNAYEADVVIPVGRIKPHTDFHGPIESGLMKMIAIGLGKQKGADVFHSHGFPEFHRLIPAVGRFSISHVNMTFGVGIVENGHSHVSLIEAIPGSRIHEREIELLKIARE